MQRASAFSEGLRKIEPSGHSASGNSLGVGAYRSTTRRASGSLAGSSTRCGIPLRLRKLPSRATSGEEAAPISSGPPAPASIRPTRLKIRALMIFSPSTASAISKRRSCSGGINTPRSSPTAVASTNERRPESWPELTREHAGAVLNDGEIVSAAVAPRDAQGTRVHHEYPWIWLAGLVQPLAVRVLPQRAEAHEPLDLLRREHRKRLGIPCLDRRRGKVRANHSSFRSRTTVTI